MARIINIGNRLPYTEALQQEYIEDYNKAEIREDKQSQVNRAADRFIVWMERYLESVEGTNIPWYFIAAVHHMECANDFSRQILNGQRWTQRTTIVPTGHGPWSSWEASTKYAIRYKGLDQIMDWDLPRVLYQLERWNGIGYRYSYRNIPTPYLYSATTIYSRGKFVSDDRYNPNAVSKQIGAVAVFKELQDRGVMDWESPVDPVEVREEGDPREGQQVAPMRYSAYRVEHADDLQRFLNRFDEIQPKLVVDGLPWRKTSNAFYKIFQNYLPGDPRHKAA